MKPTLVNAAASVAHFLTHDMWCRTCNPVTTRRRSRYVKAVRDNADMTYFRNLVEQDRVMQDARLADLRTALTEQGAESWQADLLVKLVDEYRQGKRNIVVAMPYQHPTVGGR